MVLDFTIHARGAMWTGAVYLTVLVQPTSTPIQTGVRGTEMLLLALVHTAATGGCRDRGQGRVLFDCGVVTGPGD